MPSYKIKSGSNRTFAFNIKSGSQLTQYLVAKAANQKRLKSSRKPRIINNGIVAVDDVSIAAGVKNINWLRIARYKLLQRELILLRKKQKVLDRVIMNTLQTFTNETTKHFRFSPFHACVEIYQSQIQHKLVTVECAIMRQCAQSIANILRNWKGFKPDSQSPSFRYYFKHSRGWFDVKKASIIASDFWIPILTIIREFVEKTAARLFENKKCTAHDTYCECLNAVILKSLFESELKVPNARKMWLVAASSYSVFLGEYNNDLLIGVALGSTTKNREIRRKYLECLATKHDAFQRSYYDAMAHYLYWNVSPLSTVSHEPKQHAPFLDAQCVVVVYEPSSNQSSLGMNRGQRAVPPPMPSSTGPTWRFASTICCDDRVCVYNK
eukprot:478127_1